MLQTRPVTIEEFDEFIRQPEHVSRDFELIAGEIVEKMVSKPKASMIAVRIVSLIGTHIQPQKLGRVTGADGGYQVGADRYIPDAAYISKARQPNIPDEAYNPLPPDLAVEVLSPSNTSDEMRIKIANYLAAGSVVWVVDGDRQRIEVYQPGQAPQVLGA
ncbi:MAG: Uma2 family endonuclease, partial [Anaerolineae bacterium]|nr:Uma2 family endonuclease [Anaerolineae bacterium]